MREYAKVRRETHFKTVNKLQTEGWELIAKEISVDPHIGEQKITFVLGYTYQQLAKELLGIIKTYEQHGLKDKLFNQIAEKNQDKLDDIEIYNGWGTKTVTDTTKFMTKYDQYVNDGDKEYVIKEESFEITDDDLTF